MAKKINKLKKKITFRHYFLPKWGEIGREREKKIQSRIPFILDPGKIILKKIEIEIKKLKNLFPALLLAKTGLDRPKKKKKNFNPEFRSYQTPARIFQKKQQKNSKN